MARQAEPKTFPIQFVERNVSGKELAELAGPGRLLIRSIFFTLQGEGPFMGQSAVFVRLAGCNRGAKIDCDWCDTDFLIEKSTAMPIKDIVAKVRGFRNPQALDKPLVVITGGEPLLQATLSDLVLALNDEGYVVQIETNGDLLRSNSLPRAIVVVSPKVSMRARRYTKPHREMLERADYLKFVVSSDPESPYHDLPAYVYDFADLKGSSRVFVSPVNEYARPLLNGEVASMWSGAYNIERMRENHRYAGRLALDRNFRLSVQMHTLIELE